MENRTPGQIAHDAILGAADAKNEALIAEKTAKRMFAACFIAADGKNLEERRANANLADAYIHATNVEMDKAQAANIAKAKADAAELLFEEWRTNASTRRAEMNMR